MPLDAMKDEEDNDQNNSDSELHHPLPQEDRLQDEPHILGLPDICEKAHTETIDAREQVPRYVDGVLDIFCPEKYPCETDQHKSYQYLNIRISFFVSV